MSKLKDAVPLRHATRKYDGTAPAPQDIRKIEQYIREINETTDLNFIFVENGEEGFNSFLKSYGFLSGVKSVILLSGDKSMPHVKEKVGYYGENLVLHLTAMGYDTCWVGGTFSKNSYSTLVQDNEIFCVITLGKALRKTLTAGERFIKKYLTKARQPIEKRITSDTLNIPTWLQEGLQCLVAAPSALNGQKPHCHYTNGNLTMTVKDSITFDLVDLGIAKIHFEIGANGTFELGNGAMFRRK